MESDTLLKRQLNLIDKVPNTTIENDESFTNLISSCEILFIIIIYINHLQNKNNLHLILL